MMLTLYANANETIKQYKGDNRFVFKPRTTTPGEVLWNYLEAQVVKLATIYSGESQFYYYKFLIRHFLPYIGYEMERTGQFVVDENKLLEIVNEGCKYFYRREFIRAYPEYRSYLKYFNLKELDFVEEGERFEQIRNAVCNDLRLVKQKKKAFELLHQNFRDFFAAVHVLNELQMELQNQQIPLVLTLRPLPIYIRRFVGQISGEIYQAETPTPPPTLLMQTLDSLRGVFEEEKTGYAVWNIVNTWKDTRFHLGGANLTELNLLGTGLQDAVCYTRNGCMYNSVRFDKSLINEKYFLPQGHNRNILSIAFHPDGKTFISGGADHMIKAWDLRSGECLATFHGHGGHISSLSFHPDGNTFISGAADKTIKVWDWKTAECLPTFEARSRYSVNSVAFHPDGKIFISASDETIEAWDLKKRERVATFETFHSDMYIRSAANDVRTVAFHPYGKIFISVGKDDTIKVWDFQTRESLATFPKHDFQVKSLAFHPNGKTFISGARIIRAWDLDTGECIATFQGHDSYVGSIAFHPDGKTFISASEDKTIKAWDVDTGECLATFQGHNGVVSSIAFHPDGKTFISASWDNTMKAWDAQSLECLTTFTGNNSDVKSVTFHPEGKIFISGSADKTIKSWNLHTGECVTTFRGHNFAINSVAFHPDGKTFISASSGKTARAWNLQTGECLVTFEDKSFDVNSLAFHPDGKTFISSSDDFLHSWDLQKAEYNFRRLSFGYQTTSIAFHPDGKIFICGTADSTVNDATTVKVFDWQTKECLATFHGHDNRFNCVAFNPNGRIFISSSADN